MKEQLKSAIATLHKVAMALQARKFLARGIKNDVLRAKAESDALTDDEIMALCADASEAGAMALAQESR